MSSDATVASYLASSVAAAMGDAEVAWTSRATDVRGAAGPGTAVVATVDGIAEVMGRAGSVVAIEDATLRGAQVAALVRADDVHGAHLAVGAGARWLLSPAALDTAAHDIVAAITGPPRSALARRAAEGPGEAEWFARSFGAPWDAAYEDAAIVIAAGGERAEQAAELAALLDCPRASALRVLRRFSEAVAGDARSNQQVVAAGAELTLAAIARRRPLRATPLRPTGLEVALRAVDADPALTEQAGVSPRELAELRALEQEWRTVQRSDARVGRRGAGEWRAAREFAAGRVVGRSGGSGADKLAAQRALLGRVERALDRLRLARIDRERPGLVRLASGGRTQPARITSRGPS